MLNKGHEVQLINWVMVVERRLKNVQARIAINR